MTQKRSAKDAHNMQEKTASQLCFAVISCKIIVVYDSAYDKKTHEWYIYKK